MNITHNHNTASYAHLDDDEYVNHFNTNKYLSMYAYVDNAPAINFIIENLVRILTEKKTQLGHDRALEFGGGPSLLAAFILAHQVKSIRFSDYVPSNLAAVEDWMKETSNAHDWSNVFDRIIQEYKKQTGDTSARRSDWEKRLREAVKHGGMSKCNVNADDCPILSEEPYRYDIVLSSICLEEACGTYSIYKQTIKRLYTLLKDNGLLILIHALNQTYYIQNDRRHHTLSLNRTIVIEALREAGFVDIHDESQNHEADSTTDGNGIMAISAFKPRVSF